MEKRKVIIDCDPGIDDSLAILLALNSDELEVLGLTITSGNVPARMGAKNALKTLQIANRLDIPVYVGEEFPLQRKLITAQDTHGEDGIGENFYDDVKGEILEDGVDFIIDTLSEGGKAEQKDGIISYYGSKWDRKQSKPKTEYRLYTAEGSYYTITKIEYDFAVYMMEKSA